MKTYKTGTIALLLITSLSACANWPGYRGDQEAVAANELDSKKMDDARKVANYFERINQRNTTTRIKKLAAETPVKPFRISIEQALNTYVPKEFKLNVDPDINLKSQINYDPSVSWVEALGKAFAEISIEMDANMYRKQMFVRAYQTTLLEIVNRYVPHDYEVYIDGGIDESVEIRYDANLHWTEALSEGAALGGIHVKVNLTERIVHMEPRSVSNAAELKVSVAPKPTISKGNGPRITSR